MNLYKIHYPSGKRFVLMGTFVLAEIPGHSLCPCIDHGTGKDVSFLDPRAVIVDDDTKVVYSPRSCIDGMAPAMAKWLRDNPAWDRIGDLGPMR